MTISLNEPGLSPRDPNLNGWPAVVAAVTRDDLARNGACRVGLERWALGLAPTASAVPPASAASWMDATEARRWVLMASRSDGYGVGASTGDAHGDGIGIGGLCSDDGDGYGVGACLSDPSGGGLGGARDGAESGGDGHSEEER